MCGLQEIPDTSSASWLEYPAHASTNLIGLHSGWGSKQRGQGVDGLSDCSTFLSILRLQQDPANQRMQYASLPDLQPILQIVVHSCSFLLLFDSNAGLAGLAKPTLSACGQLDYSCCSCCSHTCCLLDILLFVLACQACRIQDLAGYVHQLVTSGPLSPLSSSAESSSIVCVSGAIFDSV